MPNRSAAPLDTGREPVLTEPDSVVLLTPISLGADGETRTRDPPIPGGILPLNYVRWWTTCAVLEWGPVSNQALRGFTPGDFLRPTPHDLASYFRLLQLDTCPVLSHVLHVSAPNMPRCGRNGQQPVQSLD